MTNIIPSLLIRLSYVIIGLILRDQMPISDFPPLLRSSNWKIYALSTARSDRKISEPERSGTKLDQSAEGHKIGLLLNDCLDDDNVDENPSPTWDQQQGSTAGSKRSMSLSKRKQRMRNHLYFWLFRSLNSWQRSSEYQLQRTTWLQGVHIVCFLFMYSHKERAERALINPWSAFEKQAVLRMRDCTDISPVSAPRHESIIPLCKTEFGFIRVITSLKKFEICPMSELMLGYSRSPKHQHLKCCGGASSFGGVNPDGALQINSSSLSLYAFCTWL